MRPSAAAIATDATPIAARNLPRGRRGEERNDMAVVKDRVSGTHRREVEILPAQLRSAWQSFCSMNR